MVSRLVEGIEEVTEQPKRGADQNQWIKPNETDAEELDDRHPRPSIVIPITRHIDEG